MTSKNILIVEDNIHLGMLLSEYLETQDYKVKLCRNGASGLRNFKKQRFDICILDVMLPEMDGYSLAKEIQKEDKEIPFLFLTARSMKEDKLRGYAVGAEDFITKPFDEEELLCRLQVILRRNEKTEVAEVLPTQFTLGDYYFDYLQQELSYKNTSRRITEKENEVLRLLCLHQNRILKREEAVEQIYGKRDYFLGRSFDVFISRIRKMLKKDPKVNIENVFRVGFILSVKD